MLGEPADGVELVRGQLEVGGLKLNEELNAYDVEDVTYLTDYAQSYVDGTNPDVDYTEDENGNVMDTHTTLTYTIESL